MAVKTRATILTDIVGRFLTGVLKNITAKKHRDQHTDMAESVEYILEGARNVAGTTLLLDWSKGYVGDLAGAAVTGDVTINGSGALPGAWSLIKHNDASIPAINGAVNLIQLHSLAANYQTGSNNYLFFRCTQAAPLTVTVELLNLEGGAGGIPTKIEFGTNKVETTSTEIQADIDSLRMLLIRKLSTTSQVLLGDVTKGNIFIASTEPSTEASNFLAAYLRNQLIFDAKENTGSIEILLGAIATGNITWLQIKEAADQIILHADNILLDKLFALADASPSEKALSMGAGGRVQYGPLSKINTGTTSVETSTTAIDMYVLTFQFFNAESIGPNRTLSIGDVLNDTGVKLSAPGSGGAGNHYVSINAQGEEGLKVENLAGTSLNTTVSAGGGVILDLFEASNRLDITADIINLTNALTIDSDAPGKLLIREDSVGEMQEVEYEAFRNIEGAGAPGAGTTKAWYTGQHYTDTATGDIYRVITPSTNPDSAATGSTFTQIGGSAPTSYYLSLLELSIDGANIIESVAESPSGDWDAVLPSSQRIDLSSPTRTLNSGFTVNANDITITNAGVYKISVGVTITLKASGTYAVVQLVHDDTTVLDARAVSGNVNGDSSHSMTSIISASASDTVSVRIDTSASGNDTWLKSYSITIESI